MIKKLNYGWQAGGGYTEPTREIVCDKINELVDTINRQERVIKTLLDGLERYAKEKQEANMEIVAMITKGDGNV